MAFARVSFVRFCTDVLRLKLTPAWVVLLKVAVDGVQPRDLVGDERELARQLFGDVDEVPPSARRVQVWRLGRASGKSTIAAALAVYSAWSADLSRVGPGQLPSASVVSPTKAIAKIALGIARQLVRDSALERAVVDKSDTSEGFLLQRRHDGRLVALRCVAAAKGGANLRGVDQTALIIDESEFLASGADTEYAVTDRDQIAAVMPRLLEYVVCISTPWPTENATAEFFDRNHGHPVDALAVLGSSMLMRPTPELAADIDREQQRDPETAAREFFCVAGARGGSRLFDPAMVDASVVEGRPLVIAAPVGVMLGAGGDLGLERDSSAIAVVGNGAGILNVLEVDEIRPAKGAPLVPGYVIGQRFVPVLKRHGARSIMMDAHYRQSAIEHLAPAAVQFLDAPVGMQGKYDVYMQARAVIHAGRLRIPPIPRLVAQLKAISSTPLPGGGTRISSPRRAGQGHGDICSALVLAMYECRDLVASGLTTSRPVVFAGPPSRGAGAVVDPRAGADRPQLQPTSRAVTSSAEFGRLGRTGSPWSRRPLGW